MVSRSPGPPWTSPTTPIPVPLRDSAEQHAGPARLGHLVHRSGVVHLRRVRPGQLTLLRRHHRNPQSDHHYEIHEFHDDGSEKTLHLAIQDTNKQDEQVNYGYDSAGRVNSVVYNFGGSSQNLVLGPPAEPDLRRVRPPHVTRKYGPATILNATFATTGRRLLTDRKVTWNAVSRAIFRIRRAGASSPTILLAESRTRKETIVLGGAILQNLTFSNQYEALGRLSNHGGLGDYQHFCIRRLPRATSATMRLAIFSREQQCQQVHPSALTELCGAGSRPHLRPQLQDRHGRPRRPPATSAMTAPAIP